jgi:hypothetical protein
LPFSRCTCFFKVRTCHFRFSCLFLVLMLFQGARAF